MSSSAAENHTTTRPHELHLCGKEAPSAELGLLDYLEVIATRKRLILSVACAALVVSVTVSLLLPNLYSATALVLPPDQSSGVLGSLLGGLPNGVSSVAGDLLGKSTPSDLYARMLTSDAMSDTIIDRFKLMEVYQQKYRADLYAKLEKMVDVSVGKKDGVVSIVVTDPDPKRAAAIANAYVEELDKLETRLQVTDARSDSTFLEGRLVKAKADLAKAEENLRAFQSTNKAVDVPEQAKGVIQGVGQLEGQLAAEEVKLSGLRRMFTDGSADVKNQLTVVNNLRGQIAKFEGRRAGNAIPGVASIPALGEQYLRLMRELKIQESLVEFLTKEYEMSKLTQSKEVAGVQVIQKATVPDRKSKPKRSLIVIGSVCVATFLATVLAFLLEWMSRMPVEDRERLARITRLLLPFGGRKGSVDAARTSA